MNPDLETALLVGLGVVAVFVVALLVPRRVRPAHSTDAKLDVVQTQLGALGGRLDEVERKQNVADHDLRNVRQVVGSLATKENVGSVATQVAEMRGELKGVVSSTDALTCSVRRVEDFLMKTAAETIVHGREPQDGRPGHS